MTESQDARAALDDLASARNRLAAGQSYPWWRHAAVGAMLAAVVSLEALHLPGGPLLPTGIIVAAIAIKRNDMRRNGTRLYRSYGVAHLVAVAIASLVMLGIVVAIRQFAGADSTAINLGLMALAFVLGTIASWVIARVRLSALRDNDAR